MRPLLLGFILLGAVACTDTGTTPTPTVDSEDASYSTTTSDQTIDFSPSQVICGGPNAPAGTQFAPLTFSAGWLVANPGFDCTGVLDHTSNTGGLVYGSIDNTLDQNFVLAHPVHQVWLWVQSGFCCGLGVPGVTFTALDANGDVVGTSGAFSIGSTWFQVLLFAPGNTITKVRLNSPFLGVPKYIAIDDVKLTTLVEVPDPEVQTIAFTSEPPNPAYPGEAYTVAATGGASGNPVTFSSLTMSVCSVEGVAVMFVAPGTCTLAADQEGSAGFAAAPQVSQTITVSARIGQSIGFTSSPPSPAYVGGTYSISATGGASGNAVVFSSLTPTVCAVTGSIATFVAAGGCTIAADQSGTAAFTAAAQETQSVAVTLAPILFAFKGFYPPVDGNGVLNMMKAGAAVPIKFSLGGNKGMSIFQNVPTSSPLTCTNAPTDAVEVTVTATTSGLQYDAAGVQYIYVWKTDASWKNTCRTFRLTLSDGTTHTANFEFKK